MRRPVLLIFFLAMCLGGHIYLSSKVWKIRASVRSSDEVGYVLPSKFSRVLALGYQGVLSDYLFLKGSTFYGERQLQKKELSRDDWSYFVATLDAITDLDPCFYDPYLLAEGFLAWQGQVGEANRLLEKGLKCRDWDWHLPYFIGFNNFYFLHDYEAGSKYIMKAAQLNASPPFLKTLGARLAFYGGKTETAVLFLKDMLAQADDPRFRVPLENRLLALERASNLEKLVQKYKAQNGHIPKEMEDLVTAGYIDRLPPDPYGGDWVVLKNGRVFSTSKFVATK